MSNYLYTWLDMAKTQTTTSRILTPNYDTNQLTLLARQNQLIMLAGYDINSMEFSFIIKNITYGSYIRNLINNLINRWLIEDVYLAIGEEEVPSTEIVNKFGKKVLDRLSKNYETYCKRLELQSKYLTDIKNTISSTSESVSRHNDTPNQNNDYSADIYTSDITKNTNTTTTDIDAIDRYNQVLATIDDIYSEWLKEFKELEIYGEY